MRGMDIATTIARLAPLYRARLVPIWRIRQEFPLVSHEDLNAELLRLEATRVIDLKIMNDPTAPDVLEHGGPDAGIDQRPVFDLATKRRNDGRGLIWYVSVPS